MAKRNTLDTMSKGQLIKALDKEFSRFVRLTAADDNGWVTCPTCGRYSQWNDAMDCSHGIPCGNYNVRWDLRNVIVQCMQENRNRHKFFENGLKVLDILIERWGEEEIAQMKAISKMKNQKPDDDWLRMTIGEYRAKNKKLREEKGLA